MTILVVGGSGFIGTEVMNSMNSNRVSAVAYDLMVSDSVGDTGRWIRADILELHSLERLLFDYEVEAIIHLVGLPAIEYCQKNPDFSFQLNTLSVQNTLEAMRRGDVKRIVFASSAAVYGKPTTSAISENDLAIPNSTYGHHKLIAEEAIRAYQEAYGIEYTILRLFNVYGGNPMSGKEVISIYIRNALRGEPLIVRGPGKFRDFVHVEDVASLFTKAATAPYSNIIANVGTGEGTTLKQVAELVQRCSPSAVIKYEDAADDGTGYRADIKVVRDRFAFAPRESRNGISEHIRRSLEVLGAVRGVTTNG